MFPLSMLAATVQHLQAETRLSLELCQSSAFFKVIPALTASSKIEGAF